MLVSVTRAKCEPAEDWTGSNNDGRSGDGKTDTRVEGNERAGERVELRNAAQVKEREEVRRKAWKVDQPNE